MDKIKSSSIYLQVTVAALLYNLFHLLAWELPLAVKMSWRINIVGDIFILLVGILSMILISMRNKIGLMFGMIPALWAILLQWLLVYVISGYKEPNGVWWYPLFPIFQGIMIVFFTILAWRDNNERFDSINKTGLQSPSIYFYAISGFLLMQTGQKFVREMVVGFRQEGGITAVIGVLLVTLIMIVAAAMVLKRMKGSLGLALFSGIIVLMQPIVYHLIMGKPCLGGIWWYPIFTAIQGAFIVYFSLLPFFNKRKIADQIHS